MRYPHWMLRVVSIGVAAAMLATGLSGVSSAAGVATPQVISVTGGTTSPLVINMDASAADQNVLVGVLLNQPTLTQPFSDRILDELDAHPLLAAVPHKTDPTWFTYNGTPNLANGVLSITIPLADVHTQIPGWLTQIIAGAAGWLAGILAAALCTATVTGAAPVICPTVQGATTAFVWTLVAGAIGKGTIYDKDVWTQAIAAGLVGAVAGTVWNAYLGPWVATHARPIFVAIRDAVVGTLRSWASWIGDTAATTANYAFDLITYVKDNIVQVATDIARRAGYITSVAVVRLMPLGDSITAGEYSTTGDGYRRVLYDELKAQGHTTEDFVGTLVHGSMCDPQNEGHSGYTIANDAALTNQALATYRPNVVTVMLGTNDMNQNLDVANAPARLGSLIDQIVSAEPNATVLVASIVPSTDPAIEARITAYNAALPAVVGARRDAGKHVAFVNMSSVGTADLANTLHPNDAGYQKIGDIFDDGVSAAILAGWVTPPVTTSTPVPTACVEPTGGGSVSPPALDNPVRFADYNGDGKADYLAVAADGSARGYLYKGGDPVAGAPSGWHDQGVIAYGTGASGRNVAFADVNGDGKADYLVIDNNTGTVDASINTGGNSISPTGWQPSTRIAFGVGTPAGSSYVEMADINGDGKADYLVINRTTGAVKVSINQYNNITGWAWAPQVQIATGFGGSPSIQFADINGDGKADYLLVGIDGSTTQAWLNNGTDAPGGHGWTGIGTLPPRRAGSGSVLFADINGDGRADYLDVGADRSVRVWINRGGDLSSSLGWFAQGQFAYGEGVFGDLIQFADVNGDGRGDYLVVSPFDGSVHAWLNEGGDSGAGGWTPLGPIANGVGSPRRQVRFADVNGDGKTDYLIVNDNGSVTGYLNSGVNSYTKVPIAAGVGYPGSQVRFADVNGDGKADYLVVGDNGSVQAWINNGTDAAGANGWVPRGRIATGVGSPVSQVQFADINGDGKADYLVVHDNGSVQAWINNGGDTVSSTGVVTNGWIQRGQIATGVGFPGSQVQFADINGDGRADYLGVTPGTGAVSAWLNDGGDVVTATGTANGWVDRGQITGGVPGL